MSIDYSPHIHESIRKPKKRGNTNINLNVRNTNTFMKQFEQNASGVTVNRVYSISESSHTTQSNYNLTQQESTLFGDILDFQIQNDRLDAISREMKILGDTVSVMMYGEVIDLHDALEDDEEIFNKLQSNYADLDNLYFVSKLLSIVNYYLDNVDQSVDAILGLNMSIRYFSSQERILQVEDFEADCIQTTSKIDLEDELFAVNYVSDKNLVKNYLCDLYNQIIDFNITKNAIKKLNNGKNMDMLLLQHKDTFNSKFVELVKVIEYAKSQNDKFSEYMYSRYKLITDLYETIEE